MNYRHDLPLYLQVAERIRERLGREHAVNTTLPSEAALARQLRVSTRTVREAMLVLEAHGLIQRRQGSLARVQRRGQKPVGLYSELDLLHPDTPRFYPMMCGLVRARLAQHDVETRLYSGRSREGEAPGKMSCPELLADAQAGRLSAVAAWAAYPLADELQAMAREGIPVVDDYSAAHAAFAPVLCLETAVRHLVEQGRRHIALIAWERPEPAEGRSGEQGPKSQAFAQALQQHGLAVHPQWIRCSLSHAIPSAGWEEFREIWTAARQKPDGLVVLDENYLADIAMAVSHLGIRVPEQLSIVARTSRHIPSKLPMPIARMELDSDLFAQCIVHRLLQSLGRNVEPLKLEGAHPYRLVLPDALGGEQASDQAKLPPIHERP